MASIDCTKSAGSEQLHEYSRERLVVQESRELIEPYMFCDYMCADLFDDPVQCCVNGCAFCRTCITLWLSSRKGEGNMKCCCVCKGNLLPPGVFVPSKHIKDKIGTLKIKCRHDGCKFWRGTFDSLSQHLRTDCLEEPVKCLNAEWGCAWTSKRGIWDAEYPHHRCEHIPVLQMNAALAENKKLKAEHAESAKLQADLKGEVDSLKNQLKDAKKVIKDLKKDVVSLKQELRSGLRRSHRCAVTTNNVPNSPAESSSNDDDDNDDGVNGRLDHNVPAHTGSDGYDTATMEGLFESRNADASAMSSLLPDLRRRATNQQSLQADNALLDAAAESNVRRVMMLIAQDADVNTVNKNGESALLFASTAGNTDILSALLAAGAQIDHANKRGFTALMNASWDNCVAAADLLIMARANLELVATDLGTALSIAIARNHPDVVALLVRAGANLEYRVSPSEGTGLIVAASWARLKIVELLVQGGADVNATILIKTKHKTALHVAYITYSSKLSKVEKQQRMKNYTAIRKVLKAAMSEGKSTGNITGDHSDTSEDEDDEDVSKVDKMESAIASDTISGQASSGGRASSAAQIPMGTTKLNNSANSFTMLTPRAAPPTEQDMDVVFLETRTSPHNSPSTTALPTPPAPVPVPALATAPATAFESSEMEIGGLELLRPSSRICETPVVGILGNNRDKTRGKPIIQSSNGRSSHTACDLSSDVTGDDNAASSDTGGKMAAEGFRGTPPLPDDLHTVAARSNNVSIHRSGKEGGRKKKRKGISEAEKNEWFWQGDEEELACHLFRCSPTKPNQSRSNDSSKNTSSPRQVSKAARH